MTELSSVMMRLDAHTKRLQDKAQAARPGGDDEQALVVQGLALVSEALLRIGRDVRTLRLQLADKS